MKGRLDRKGDHQSWLQHRCKQGGPGAPPGLGGALFIGKFSPPWFLVSCSSCTRQHVQSVLMDLSGNGSRGFGGLFVVLVPLYWLSPSVSSSCPLLDPAPALELSLCCSVTTDQNKEVGPRTVLPQKGAAPSLHGPFLVTSWSDPGLTLLQWTSGI